MRLDVPVKHENLEEPARRAHGARDRRGRESFTRKTRDPLTQVSARQVSYLFVVCVGPGLQSIEITFVAFERLARESLLDLNVAEEFFHEVAVHKTNFSHKKAHKSQKDGLNP